MLIRHRPKVRMTPMERRMLSDKLVAGEKVGIDSMILIRQAREEREARSNACR
jgi:hypothetical protein